MRRRAPLSILGLPALVMAAALAVPAAAQETQQARPFTYQDLIGLNRLSDPRVSPDGTQVVYAVRATDLENDRGVTSLYIQPLSGEGEARRLAVSDQGANTARWGAEGRLYFLSSRSGSNQVWMTDA